MHYYHPSYGPLRPVVTIRVTISVTVASEGDGTCDSCDASYREEPAKTAFVTSAEAYFDDILMTLA